MRRTSAVVAWLVLTPAAVGLLAQTPADPIESAIRLVNRGEFERAVASLNERIPDLVGKPERAKDLARACLYRGVALVGLGQEDQAKESFRRALSADKGIDVSSALFSPRVNSLFRLEAAILLVNQGEFERASAALNERIPELEGMPARAKDLARACLYRGVALIGLGQEEQARESFRRALSADQGIEVSPTLFSPRVIHLFEAVGGKVPEAKSRPAATAAVSGPGLKTGRPSKAPLVLSGVIAVGAPTAAYLATRNNDQAVASGSQGSACDANGVVETTFNLVEGPTACTATSSSTWGTVMVTNRSCVPQRVTLVTQSVFHDAWGGVWKGSEYYSLSSMPGQEQQNIYQHARHSRDCHREGQENEVISVNELFTVSSPTGTATRTRTVTYTRGDCPPCN